MNFTKEKFHNYGEVRTGINEKGDVWFVAKDVCDILELADVSMSLQRLSKSQKLVQTLFVSGQNRDVWTISEGGLYELAFTSRKPIAKEFRLWVTDELLPSIRKANEMKYFDLFSRESQKESMSFLLPFAEQNKAEYMIVNKLVNAIVSEKWGFEKSLKKSEMSKEMIEDRQKILNAFIANRTLLDSKGEANRNIREILGLKLPKTKTKKIKE